MSRLCGMTRVTVVMASAFSCAGAGCSKAESGHEGTTEAGPDPASSAALAVLARDRADAAPRSRAPEVAHWSGTYTSQAGSLYIPEGWKGVHWSVPDTPAGIGNGPVSLAIDGATGRVTGVVGGPLGPARVDGVALDGGLAATVTRRDPSDHGFTGTLEGTVGENQVRGSMRLSPSDANAVRSATFDLTPSRAE
jgi:hypothetical protein